MENTADHKTDIDHVEDARPKDVVHAFEQEGIANLDLKDVLPDLGKPWYKIPWLLHLNLFLVFGMLSSTNTGFDSSMLTGLQAMPAWSEYFGSPSGIRLGVLGSGIGFGSIVGSMITPWLADRFGRKHPIALGAIIICIGVILQTAAQNYGMFLVGRIIIGIGAIFSNTISPLLISELAYPSQREILTATFNILFYSGGILSAASTLGCFHMTHYTSWMWRIPSILQCFFPICQLCIYPWVPESPRFLVSKNRFDDARDVLTKYHAGGQMDSELVEFELAQIVLALDSEKEQSNSSLLDFFKTKANMHRLFVITFMACMQQFSGNALISYYLSLVLNSIGITSSSYQLVINLALNIYNMGIAFIISFLIERFRRRTMLLSSVCGMLLVFVIWTVLSAINQKRNFEDATLGKGVLAMVFLYFLAYNLGLLGLPYLYYTEVLPYYLRSKGLFIVQWTQQAIGIFNNLVNPVAMDAIEWKYYIVYCCIIGVEVFVVYFFFPETSGHTLETAAEVFGDIMIGKNDQQKQIDADEPEAEEVSLQ